ncbi:adenosylcobinamide-GDP ribazoletransferase [Vibrio fluvialis]|jgi:adenosylcobinamide-GDP ribazoletransferase|uniref:adenosylcobinamide-GDP ribazoletransferase n=1 Tax=Vibrio fluvialis TaxID=676 RepID=UPI0015599C9B|nr:adenosylcobinamide-GDP ribazoletransferase [Vibrio fluvialis]EKO3915639.1 adenosylcobinamide-GDP ribazoletransferase [Vibrio fluvialis]EKO3981006.1 adenosylcobinamide-GDP ribazoletransferase [Vibrio fluvialis]EKO5152316.1 adenosylcobinamide-GDP ribazoletransferase [Vibrio fluvialis]ELI1837391.1 adenosylcobinamide-GDP ribazoletransferase [Vibrio fluvialis]ELK3677654.1 adenosylcobinamide-GDP ribazoletransferase [Vibrio fluvialis]
MPTVIKYQWELFLLAVSFFSRLPVPASLPYSSERMNQAGRYFALVGLLLGALCAGVFTLFSHLFSPAISVFLTMVVSLLLTGAFHEDGLTDMADGIGGGMTVERRLTIMKDSRIGTYGASALVMALLGKFLFLSSLAEQMSLFSVWLLGYTLSRAVAASLIYDMPYVSDPDSSKSKPLANRQSRKELALLLVSGLIPCLWFSPQVFGGAVVVSVAIRCALKHWLMKRLGGFTGDCLGGTQQIVELSLYLLLLAYLHVGIAVRGGLL